MAMLADFFKNSPKGLFAGSSSTSCQPSSSLSLLQSLWSGCIILSTFTALIQTESRREVRLRKINHRRSNPQIWGFFPVSAVHILGMGNGASTAAGSPSQHNVLFQRVERLIRAGEYVEDYNAYSGAVKTAINNDALDALEILIKKGVGNIKRLKPLHLACSLGKLEAVELLIFAGFPPYQQNDEGHTPLHLCCLNASPSSALCATFLLLQFKKALTVFDSSGSSPLHLAVVTL